ncbi:MAG: phosphoribosyl-ATP diphosphatase [SAR324 cluster bacterium]|nr:phosphoribosyl-ATP diphosphatase [SAR324 cluster bacterium]MCZ6531973.1 phosphoribosyl-ATP diphosphatase [SAR324 cluster bacterium]MCZ6556142.1 phosphoribosyl-ATP diphosphatase [SAR324 cluster bacterium]MCZ6628435.1 phosphoribosyl-ATP diphosphatase [SAR324 cluster bacterium]MCZ6646153.1 phosphoribosyl-ATP diphosphatase [SAR324 cluster bacterium]
MAKAKASLGEVYRVIQERFGADPEESYVASLMAQGGDTVLRKVNEEFFELTLAVKSGHRQNTIHELADLWFHLLVLMASTDVTVDDIESELGSRFGTSGLSEKRSRSVKRA